MPPLTPVITSIGSARRFLEPDLLQIGSSPRISSLTAGLILDSVKGISSLAPSGRRWLTRQY
jgi:hypothetical protein